MRRMYKYISQFYINLERHSLKTTLYNSKLKSQCTRKNQLKHNNFHTTVSLTILSLGGLSGSISSKPLSSSEEYSGAVSKEEFESWRVRLQEPSSDKLMESSADKVLLFTPFLERLASCFSILAASLAFLRLCLISWSAEWILK